MVVPEFHLFEHWFLCRSAAAKFEFHILFMDDDGDKFEGILINW